eukprot:TRINITY_DN16403_c0_g1_i1.p2 TRINITY_DN16403_c0_g1~~TRINITY_DN16403_c0_g1_i1.p2  ORF type:complete len:103 (-),score=15.34 TRINITY_DN16403_c0_g1_i1:45-353(-)
MLITVHTTLGYRTPNNTSELPIKQVVQHVQTANAVDVAPCGSINFPTEHMDTIDRGASFATKQTNVKFDSDSDGSNATTQPSKQALKIAVIVVSKLNVSIIS